MRQSFGLFPVIGLCGWVALATLVGLAPAASARPPQAVRDLVRADRVTLDTLFACGSVGQIPTGFLPGWAIVDPGSRRTVAKSRRIHFVWQGKVFHGDGTGHNRLFGMTAVPMTVYHGQSWHDGAPAIVVDYSDSWRIFQNVRDEIREISPGVYLGRTYVQKRTGPEMVAMFTLQTADSR